MMAALIIQYTCIPTYGTYNQACSKATEAFLKQSGTERTLGDIESYGRKEATNAAIKYAGKENIEAVGSFFYVYNVAKAQKIDIKLPNFGIANSIDTTLTPKSGQVGFHWSFK